MKIKLKGLRKVLQNLDTLSIHIDMMALEILHKLTDIGYGQAKVGFSKAIYDGNNDTEVYIEWDSNNNSAKVVADGVSVLYIEFGAGATYIDYQPLRFQVKPQVDKIGTRGKGQGATMNWWFYYNKGITPKHKSSSYWAVRNGVSGTKGNPPARAMWGADMEMRNRIEKVLMEVVKKYVRH